MTPRVLSRELKSLTHMGLVERQELSDVPRRVEYRLRAVGQSLLPVISVMHEWGVGNLVSEERLREMRRKEES